MENNQNNSDNSGELSPSLISELDAIGAGHNLDATGCGCPNCSGSARRVAEAVAAADSFESAARILGGFSAADRRAYLAASVLALLELSVAAMHHSGELGDCDMSASAATLIAAELWRGASVRPPSDRLDVAGKVCRAFVDLPSRDIEGGN